MARLLTFPHPSGIVSVTPISGPNARNSGSNTASDGSEQTFQGIGDVVALRLGFVAKKGRPARRDRGLFRGLHSGANAVRYQFCDFDLMSPEDAGVVGDFEEQTWDNGEPWSNGQGWQPSYPVVPVASASSQDSGIVNLADEFWGHSLGMGDYIGFFPFHFGLYCVTEVIDDGEYRIWPRLRKALTTDDYATLHPTLVMKTMPGGTSMSRGITHTENVSVDLIEVFDYHVRSHFTD